MDKDGNLVESPYPDAFCYFPTKEHTALKFIVHAPFLLTESRENIKADQKHNHEMIDTLANLTVSSILHLRDIGLESGKQIINDDVYLNIFPLKSSVFTKIGDRDKISFMPFYKAVHNMVVHETIVPCTYGGDYVLAEDACWARTPAISDTFNDDHIQSMTGYKDTRWIFQSQNNWNSAQQNKKDFYYYMDSVFDDIGFGIKYKYRYGFDHTIDDAFLLRSKNLPDFIRTDNIKWMLELYKYAAVNVANKKMAKTASIFLDSEGRACPLFDENGDPVLYLPSEIKTLRTIHPELLKYEDSRKLVIELGISEPSKIDQIRDGILKKYEDGTYGAEEDFNKIFRVYNALETSDQDYLVDIIKNSSFRIKAKSADGKGHGFEAPGNLYFRSREMENYFRTNGDCLFVDECLLEGKEKEKTIFLERLGLFRSPNTYERRITEVQAYKIRNDWTSRRDYKWVEQYLEGAEDCIKEIIQNDDKFRSILLWNILRSFVKETSCPTLSKYLYGEYLYRTRGEFVVDSTFESTCLKALKTKAWLFDRTGKRIAPSAATLDAVAEEYNFASPESKVLIKSLQIKDAKFNATENRLMGIGSYAEELGLSEEEAKAALWKYKEDLSRTTVEDNNKQKAGKDPDTSIIEWLQEKSSEETSQATIITPVAESEASDVYGEIEAKRTAISQNSDKTDAATNVDEEPVMEQDDFIMPTVETKKKIEKKEQELAEEIEKIRYEQNLTDRIANSKRYTYQWLMALLEKERLLTVGGEETDKKKLRAKFASVEKEENTERTIILKNPIGKVPQNIEELADVPMEFLMENGDTRKIVAEAFNIHSYSIRAKLKNAESISGINLADVREITIEFKQASFLLDELIERFKEFKYAGSFSFQQKITDNIDFIFGPPGTGKTTHLVRDIIIPKMEKGSKEKVLFITPTNKSADVVINKVMQEYGKDESYEEWLIRFGLTQDEKIDQMPIFKDKHVDFDDYEKCTLVTTIHRFWYDFCIGNDGTGTNLRDVEWDYIIIDEASMVPLAFALYPLFAASPKKFIIAGDPFQIQPVIMAEEWKNENIYTMVHLNEFKENPDTIPHRYNVELLTTQYRSIPSIGSVFSRLTYRNILKHYRKSEDRRDINFGGLSFSSLNLIRYPASRYESIYASKYLNRTSSYNVYSALLTYEFASFLNDRIAEYNEEKVSIGIISPYRAQADIIEKLCRNIKKDDKVDIQIGTIHGFQGDECDIIICVFNTPPGALTSEHMLVSNQNIINVAISRARDYLFVLTPDDDTYGFENLKIINNLIKIMKSSSGSSEVQSHAIENILFSSPSYLEDNTFSTSHQNVNVYELPERKYEIRGEEHAVDIQVHVLKDLDIYPKQEPLPSDAEINAIFEPVVASEVQVPKTDTAEENRAESSAIESRVDAEPVVDIPETIEPSVASEESDDGTELNDEKKKRIHDLIASSDGMKVKEMLKILPYNKRAVNSYLYSRNGIEYSVSEEFVWTIKGKKPEKKNSVPSVPAIKPRAAALPKEETNKPTESKKDEKPYYSNFSQQLYLVDAANKVFKDQRKFMIIENYNGGFKVRMNNSDLFELQNVPSGGYARITAKGKRLGNVSFKKEFEYSYSKTTKDFGFNVAYEDLLDVLISFSKFDKTKSVDDEEIIKRLRANIN